MAILNENILKYDNGEEIIDLDETYIRLEVLMEPRGHLIVGFYVYLSKESFENRDNPINTDVDFDFRNYNDLTINVVDKNLHEAVQINDKKISYRMLLVGMITFKHVTKERFKEVNIDLIKLYKLGEEVRFNGAFMSALERILDEQNEFGI